MTTRRTTDAKVTMIEPRGDGYTLLRGRGLSVLGQFHWAVLVAEGVVIPDEKLSLIRKQLVAMGHELITPGPKRPGRTVFNAPDWPECQACGAGYFYRREPDPKEHCTQCGAVLVLVWPAERDATINTASAPNCARCGRRPERGAVYCRCGARTGTEEEPGRRDVRGLLRPDLFAVPDESDEGEQRNEG